MPLSTRDEPSGKRLGIVLPSSNTVLEPLAANMLAGTGVSAHFSRLGVIDIALQDESREQFALQRHVEAARLLADARVDAIVWGGTSASWLGPDHDRAFCASVEAETGIPATSCVLAMNARIAATTEFSLGLVTPYTADVHAQIIETYRSMGVRCAPGAYHGGALSSDFADLHPDIIESMVREVARSGVDAIFIMCTNLRGARVASRLSSELRLSVIDSAAIAIEAGLDILAKSRDARDSSVTGADAR